MKKILFLMLMCVFIFALSISALAIERPGVPTMQGQYYLIENIEIPGQYYVYESEEIYLNDYKNDHITDEYIMLLFTDEFKDTLDEMYDEYKNLPALDESTGYTGYDEFEDYFIEIYAGFSMNERFLSEISCHLDYIREKEAAENGSSGGSNGGNTSGGNTGGSGENGGNNSGSSGTNGEPNVNVDEVMSNPDLNGMPPYCPSCGREVGLNVQTSDFCPCFDLGYKFGWSEAFNSEAFKELLTEAYQQGFIEVNTESYRDKIAHEKEVAVEEYKSSIEQQLLIEEKQNEAVEQFKRSSEQREIIENAKESAVEDFKNSSEQSSIIENAKQQAVEDFKNSPEQMEIIGEAEEGAKADLVVEMQSVMNGEAIPSEGASSDMHALIKTQILMAQDQAVNDFVGEIEAILSGDASPADGTPEAKLSETINQKINTSFESGAEYGEGNFKSSAEYKTSLTNEYNAGAKAGYQDGYVIGTNDGYADGLLDGAEAANEELYIRGQNEYKSTQEYRDIIQNTYNDGYSKGADEASNTDFTVLIVPIVVLSCIVLFSTTLSLVLRRKNKNR